MDKKRTGAQDAAKGLMIISVIFFHCLLVTSPNPQDTLLTFNPLFAIFPFLLCSFFFYTGYNYVDKGRSFKENVIRRAKQLLIPLVICFVVSIILISSMELIYNHDDVSATFKIIWDTILYSLMTQPMAFMLNFPESGVVLFELVVALGLVWFLYALFICSIFFYLLVKFTNKSLATLISVDIVLLAIAFSIGQFVGTYLPYVVESYPLILAIMLTAAYLRKSNFLNKKLETKKDWVFTIINAIIAEGLVVGTCFICHYQFGAIFTGTFPGGQFDPILKGADALIIFVFSIIGTYFVHMLCRAIVRIPVVGFCIERIGKRSALFYLFHPIFISLFSILVFQKQVIWGVGQAYFYVLVVVACLVGTGIVIDLIIKKMKKPQQMIEEVENNKAPEEN